jgi:hypothetical protein
MGVQAAERPGLLAGLDRATDRLLRLAEDGDASDPGPRLAAFELILLIHLFATVASGAFSKTHVAPALQASLAGVLAACIGLWLTRRFAPLAIACAFCTMLALQAQIFPETGNHSFLELWVLFLLVFIGRKTRDEGVVLLATLRWIVAIMLFYTGLQKLLYGTYVDGQFLAAQIMLRPPFAEVFGWFAPAEEIARLQGLQWNRVGAGPIRAEAPLLLLASNAVYLFELAIPGALLWRRTRRPAVVALLLFTLAIQSGAREVFFGGLLVSLGLLFWPRDLHSPARWLFVAYYAVLATLRFSLPDLVLR